jgi:histidine triad (HIT) family protein
LNDIQPEHNELVGELLRTASEIAKQEGIAEAGYRTGFNCNEDGGQTVFHIHLHLMGGRTFSWPPG